MKITENIMNQARKLGVNGRKGQGIIDNVSGVVIGLLVFIIIVLAVLFGISSLNPSSFFVGNPAQAQAVNATVTNTTLGIRNFSDAIPVAFTVLGVVFILGFLGLLIFMVLRFRAGASGGGGGL